MIAMIASSSPLALPLCLRLCVSTLVSQLARWLILIYAQCLHTRSSIKHYTVCVAQLYRSGYIGCALVTLHTATYLQWAMYFRRERERDKLTPKGMKMLHQCVAQSNGNTNWPFYFSFTFCSLQLQSWLRTPLGSPNDRELCLAENWSGYGIFN